MKVPFLDLTAQHATLRVELDAAIRDVLDRSAFIGGQPVKDFEQDLATFMERKHACGVSSCTSALKITLRSLHLQPEDEVITTPHTAIPTAESITLAGGNVVFADVERDTYLLDPDAVEDRITPHTRAVVLVHLYGLAGRVREFRDLCERHGIALIEDVAQAQGARAHGRRLGTFGLAGCLSFFPSKNLGGMGDGGAVVTDDSETDRFVRMFSNHGRLEKFDHLMEGSNDRLDALQAAILSVKLRVLDDWNARRREVAGWYKQALGDVEELVLPQPLPDTEPVWHLYVVRCEDRDGLRAALKEQGIASGLHYPLSLHQQPAYSRLGHGPGSFPASEEITRTCLSLPMDPVVLKREHVDAVAEAIKRYFAGRKVAGAASG